MCKNDGLENYLKIFFFFLCVYSHLGGCLPPGSAGVGLHFREAPEWSWRVHMYEKGVSISERWLWIYEKRHTWVCKRKILHWSLGYSFSTGFVTGNYNYETGCMTGILGQLKWESLKKRRKDNRLILLYKGLKGKASVPTDKLLSDRQHAWNSGKDIVVKLSWLR